MMSDVRIEDHGSVALVRPLTRAGSDWLDVNVEAECWQWFGGALAVEPRFVETLFAGMDGDGLAVE